MGEKTIKLLKLFWKGDEVYGFLRSARRFPKKWGLQRQRTGDKDRKDSFGIIEIYHKDTNRLVRSLPTL